MAPVDRYTQMAFDMVVSGKVQQAFDIGREPDAMRDAYGRVSIGEKALSRADWSRPGSLSCW